MKRGQAALEFLTTYGWAFLVILVMIGALAYFGVINPNRFLPERCSFQQELGCQDYQLSVTNGLSLYVRNNLGTTMNALRLSVANTADGGSPVACDEYDGGGTDVQLAPGGVASINCTTIPGNLPAVGDKVKVEINGTYTPAGGQFAKQISGEVFAVLVN